MANGYQRQEYGTKTGAEGDDKLQSTGRLTMIQGGSSESASDPGSGPTGSKRSYPKGSSLSMTPDFNPQKVPASTYGVKGV
jgi:hypothetical protein